MRLKSSLLVLSLFAVMSTSAQTPDETDDGMIDVVEIIPESREWSGDIYVLDDKYYVTDSVLSFYAKLGIDPKDVTASVIRASDRDYKDIIDPVKERLPEKYRTFRGLVLIQLRKR